MTCRKRKDVIETRLQSLAWDELGRCLLTSDDDRHKGGVSSAQALVGNVGTCAPMPRETSKWQPHKEQSTDAGHRGGQAVVAMKPGNAGGAKGPTLQRRDRSTSNGRSPCLKQSLMTFRSNSCGKPTNG